MMKYFNTEFCSIKNDMQSFKNDIADKMEQFQSHSSVSSISPFLGSATHSPPPVDSTMLDVGDYTNVRPIHEISQNNQNNHKNKLSFEECMQREHCYSGWKKFQKRS